MYSERLDRVRSRMRETGLTQLLVTDASSIRYLTGASVDPGERFLGLYIGSAGAPVLFLNKLFTADADGAELVVYSDTDDLTAVLLKSVDINNALGADKLMQARFLLPLCEQGVRAVLGSGCVDWVRAVKDGEEREKMRVSSGINDLVMEETTAFVREGMTEREVEAYLRSRYAAHGCEGVSFDPIVSFGANAADPHHMPDGTVLKRGDCIVLDIGGMKDGYASDMTRTWFCGGPDEKYAGIHDLVVRANEKAESIIKPGVRLCDIDAAARDIISEAGYGEYFTHRLGHFIGQEVHEYGDVSAAFTRPVEPGMCFSIEPGVYLPGRFGVRIEDLVCVTETGCEVLNKVPKKWRIL